MPLLPDLFNDAVDFALTLVFFAFDNVAVSTASSWPFSSISAALRFLAIVCTVIPVCEHFCEDKTNKKMQAFLINGERVNSIYTISIYILG